MGECVDDQIETWRMKTLQTTCRQHADNMQTTCRQHAINHAINMLSTWYQHAINMPAIRCARLCSPTSQPESHRSLGWLRPSDDAVISRVADDELEIVDTDGNACFRLVEIPAKKVLRTR
jgi:hypothetical protein